MPGSIPLSVKNGDALLMVGTVKGAFLLASDPSRRRWRTGGPFSPGLSVYAMAYDGRAGRHRVWAAPQSMHFGAELVASDDFGRTWERSETPKVRFAETTGASLANIWQITPGREEEPERLYCGVEPAALFESRDAGDTWALNEGLWNHPHRPRWAPGGGGLCLHSILPDPADARRVTVAISTGGVYRTDDGGQSWAVKNRGVRAEFLPDKYPEFGQCVHKIVSHPSRPARLFLQNHFGLYRSDDGADSWRDIANGVPSDFGFCMAVHPHEPETVFILPLEADQFRWVPEGKLRVYRTRNGGRSWQPLSRGLPKGRVFEAVLRDAMDTDPFDPAGVYFGTRSGKVYGSRNAGDAWELILEGLPAVTCVKAARVENIGRARMPLRAATPKRSPRRAKRRAA